MPVEWYSNRSNLCTVYKTEFLGSDTCSQVNVPLSPPFIPFKHIQKFKRKFITIPNAFLQPIINLLESRPYRRLTNPVRLKLNQNELIDVFNKDNLFNLNIDFVQLILLQTTAWSLLAYEFVPIRIKNDLDGLTQTTVIVSHRIF